MFEKLLSNLPYNPSLLNQMGFYAKRLRGEAAVRRTGLVFLVLAFFVQFFAVMSPPQPTVAYSTNDMINGGISSKQEAVDRCKDNTKNYGDVLWNFGISCADVSNGTIVDSLSSRDYNSNLYSMGWIDYAKAGETSMDLAKVSQTLYARFLWSWDTAGASHYKAIKLTSHVTHKTYFILFSCGNLVAIGIPNPTPVCKYDSSILSTDDKCFKPCQFNQNIPAGSRDCFEPCPIPGLSNLPKSSPKCVAPCPYNKKLPANSPKCFPPCKYNKDISANSPKCFPPCKYDASISATSPQCKPCDKAVSSTNANACVVRHKAATNQTQNIADADGTTAQPGDTIVYTLTATNSGKATVKQFVMRENLSDVLDYADVVSLDGGTIDANHEITWPAQDIKPSAVEKHTITVKVKSPIPQTPVSTSDGGHFDLVMTNVYGNAINIKVPGGTIKTIETTSSNLPNTGPGTSLVIAGLITIMAGYFFARTRLLAEEAKLAIQENATVGA